MHRHYKASPAGEGSTGTKPPSTHMGKANYYNLYNYYNQLTNPLHIPINKIIFAPQLTKSYTL
ncbi:MAG: hypothetical protein EOP46_05335 [Sphingobacteriaceae bacterium]|nr:MAG: hypothetical protein EOP46_05335 [Sphingobacteriaceae bacterium]